MSEENGTTAVAEEEAVGDVLSFPSQGDAPGDAPEAPPAEAGPIAPEVDKVVSTAVAANDGSTLNETYGKPIMIPAELERVHPDILAARARVKEAKAEWKARKKDAKEAKDEYEESILDLVSTIDECTQPSLFNQPREDERLKAPEPASASSSAPAPEAVAAAAADISTDEDPTQSALVRMTMIADLTKHGLSEAVVKLMNEGNLYTIGDVNDYLDPNKNGGNTHKRLTDINVKGFGEGKATKYDEARNAFLKSIDDERFKRDEARKKAAEEAETAAKVEGLLDRSGDTEAAAAPPADALEAAGEDDGILSPMKVAE